jgi:uncharacterized protein YcbK (DUF882 family)
VRSVWLLLAAAMSLAGVASGDAPKPTPKKTARAAAPIVPAKYASYVSKWHAATPGKSPAVDGSGRPMLVLYSLNTNDRAELPAASDKGGFLASALDRAAFVLRDSRSGNEYPIEPRLLDVVYRIQSHFAAHEVRIISGYRTPRRSASSNHGKGRAVDLIVPGVKDDDVARFARELGFVGVGVYTASGFIHVDVRDRSYFWVDASGPGRRNRERGVLGDLAKKADAQALARGEKPTPPLVMITDVDLALRAHAPPTAPGASEEDDEDLE